MTRKSLKWSLDAMTPSQIKKLNAKLDQYQDKPRNFSEPKLKYMPTPDLRPEAIAKLQPQVRYQL
jgi:hypothetical protein